MIAFLLYNIPNGEGSLLSFRTSFYLCNTLTFACTVSWNFSESSFTLAHFFWLALLPVDFFTSCHNCFPHLCQLSLPSLSSSGFISRVSEMAKNVNIPKVSHIFFNSIYLWFEFHFQQYQLLLLCCVSISVGQFSFSITHFCNIFGRQEGNDWHPWLCVHWITDK